MSLYLALSLFPPCPLHFLQKMCSYRLLATFVSIPILNHHFPHCVHVWMAPQQVLLLYASSLFIVFLCVWLTCHPQKMFASPRHCRLDTLVRSQPGLPLKRDRQFGSGLFIGSRTCSHSGDYVLISCLTQGDQSLSSCTLSPTFVWKVSDWWGVSNQRQVRSFLESFPWCKSSNCEGEGHFPSGEKISGDPQILPSTPRSGS